MRFQKVQASFRSCPKQGRTRREGRRLGLRSLAAEMCQSSTGTGHRCHDGHQRGCRRNANADYTAAQASLATVPHRYRSNPSRRPEACPSCPAPASRAVSTELHSAAVQGGLRALLATRAPPGGSQDANRGVAVGAHILAALTALVLVQTVPIRGHTHAKAATRAVANRVQRHKRPDVAEHAARSVCAGNNLTSLLYLRLHPTKSGSLSRQFAAQECPPQPRPGGGLAGLARCPADFRALPRPRRRPAWWYARPAREGRTFAERKGIMSALARGGHPAAALSGVIMSVLARGPPARRAAGAHRHPHMQGRRIGWTASCRNGVGRLRINASHVAVGQSRGRRRDQGTADRLGRRC